VFNAPHPAVWLDAMRNHPAQERKSTYVRFFELPYLPEFLIGINPSKVLAKALGDGIRPDAFTESDLSYRKAWAEPRALSATINYYRAILKKPVLQISQFRITCPTLVMWGKRDAYAIPELAEASSRLCADCRIEYLDRSTHWVQHDEPGRVNELLTEFFKPMHSFQWCINTPLARLISQSM
jgi:pimeloyl-ACP methyl ester carboxylesterase